MEHETEPQQGHIVGAPPSGTTPTGNRPPFSDPVPGDLDPTSPASPESTLSYQHDDSPPKHELSSPDQPQQNIEDWRREGNE